MAGTSDNGIELENRHGREHSLERLIFFSDAVFAIAITLLVIELHVPNMPDGATEQQFIQALANVIPNFLGFTLGFFVIGAFWGAHHRAFRFATHWGERLMPTSILLLFSIAALPFFTALLSDYGNRRVPVVLYCLWLTVTALFNVRMQRLATSPPVVDPLASKADIAAVRRRGMATVLGAATAMIVALVATAPYLGQISLISIPVYRRLLDLLAGWPHRVGTGSAPE